MDGNPTSGIGGARTGHQRAETSTEKLQETFIANVFKPMLPMIHIQVAMLKAAASIMEANQEAINLAARNLESFSQQQSGG